MPVTVITSIGNRTANSVTINSVTNTTETGFSNAWVLTLSAEVPFTTVKGDKITAGSNNYLIVAKSGSTLTVVGDAAITATSTTIPPTGSATTSRMYSTPGGGSTNITTPAGWCNGVVTSLTDKDWVWKGEIYREGTLDSYGTYGVSQTTTMYYHVNSDATRYFWLQPAAGHAFNDHPNKNNNKLTFNLQNGVTIKQTGGYSWLAIKFSFGGAYNAFVKYSDLQLYNWNTTTHTTATNLTVERCILVNVGAGIRAYNCLIFSGYGLADTSVVTNCTIINPVSNSGTVVSPPPYASNNTLKNCAIFGFAQDFVSVRSVATRMNEAASGYNVTDQNSFEWTNATNKFKYERNQQFQNSVMPYSFLANTSTYWNTPGPQLEDFRVRSGSALIGQAVRDQTVTDDLDILKNARSTTNPTVGCHEFSDTYYSNKKSNLIIGKLPSKRLSQQPQNAVQVDWSNSLTNGLRAVWHPAACQYIGPGNIPAPTPGTYSYLADSTGGYGVKFNGTTASRIALPAGSAGFSADYSGTRLVLFRANATNFGLVSGTVAGTLGMRLNSATSIALVAASNVAIATANIPTSTRPTVALCTADSASTQTRMHINGQLLVNTTYSGYAASTAGIWVGAITNHTSTSNFFLALSWDRALSISEAAAIQENPWQIFKPARSKTYSFQYSYDENTRPRTSLITTNNNALTLTPSTTVVIKDNFTDTDGTALQNHTPTGPSATGSWSTTLYGATTAATIQSNTLYNTSDANAIDYYIPTGSTDHYVKFTLPRARTNENIILIKAKTSPNLYQNGVLYTHDGTNHIFYPITDGTGYEYPLRMVPGTLAANDVVLIETIADNITLKINGSLIVGPFKSGFYNNSTGIMLMPSVTTPAVSLFKDIEIGRYSYSANIDCRSGTYFTATISGKNSFTVSNVPINTVYKFVLRLTIINEVYVTWWNNVIWPNNVVPYLTPNSTHLLIFQTKNGGASWQGSYTLDYAT
jgi:hypothetical protein